jgi:hypothetical protein
VNRREGNGITEEKKEKDQTRERRKIRDWEDGRMDDREKSGCVSLFSRFPHFLS